MPFPADLMKYYPGNRVEVEVLANSAGTVATRRKGVELAGETDENTQVELGAGSEGAGVGYLAEDPDEFTGDQADYAAGDSAGTATLILLKPVAVLDLAGGYAPTVGDWVRFNGSGNIEQNTGMTTAGVGTLTNTLGVDGNGNLENDTANAIEVDLREAFPFGEVFRTVADDFSEAGKVLVAVHR